MRYIQERILFAPEVEKQLQAQEAEYLNRKKERKKERKKAGETT